MSFAISSASGAQRKSLGLVSGAMDALWSNELTMEERFGAQAKHGGRWLVDRIFEAYEACVWQLCSTSAAYCASLAHAQFVAKGLLRFVFFKDLVHTI